MMRNILLLGVLGALIAGSVAQEITISGGGSGLSAVQSALLTDAVQTNDTRNVALGGNLSVSGAITGSGNAPKLRFNGTNTTVLSGTVIGEVSFENSDISNNTFPFAGTTASIRAIATRDFASTGGADTDLIFLTNDQNAPTAGTNLTLIERMRITSAGNVFISNNLTVNGAITSTNAVDAPIKAVTGSSQTNLTFWTGSAASYAALASTNASTIYFITN